jgi:ankyrin repeat protein
VEDVDARNTMGHTGLHLACQEGDEAVAWMLLEAGADVDALDF